MNAEHTPPSAIELHIEELVLYGFAPGDRDRIAAALEQELTRLLTEQGVPQSLAQAGDIAYLSAPPFRVTSSRPDMIGLQMAQSVNEGLRS